MPDASIMLELCNLLKISVNELLTGEHIAMENYKEKAEENLLELQEKKVKAQKSLLRTELVWMAIAILLAPMHLAINYYNSGRSMTSTASSQSASFRLPSAEERERITVRNSFFRR